MQAIGTFISVAILWFLITLFSRSRSSSQSLTETWIVVIGMLIIGMLTKMIFGGALGIFTLIIDVAALYFLVDKVCGLNRGMTIRICAWYFVLSFFIALFFALLAS